MNGLNIAILIPCYNEEVTIGKVINDCKRYLPTSKIFVFDNNSKDKTAILAKSAGATVIKSPLQGKGNVVKHMFSKIDADIYIMIDGDDTYPAAQLPQLITEFNSNPCDMLVGVRLNNHRPDSFRLFHSFGNRLVAFLISFLFNVKLSDILSGLRIFSRDFVKTIPLQSKGFEIETELTLQAISKGFSILESPIQYGTRPKGSYSKLSTYSDGLLIIKSIFIIFKNHQPLIFFGTISLILAISSFLAGIIPIVDYVNTQFVSHLPLAILATGLGLLSIIFFTCGIILDTIYRYHNENYVLLKNYLSIKDQMIDSGVQNDKSRDRPSTVQWS